MNLAQILPVLFLTFSVQPFARANMVGEALRRGDLNSMYRSARADRHEQMKLSVCNPSDIFALRLVSDVDELEFTLTLRRELLRDLRWAKTQEAEIDALARSRLDRLFSLHSELLDAKATYQVSKIRSNDRQSEMLKRSRLNKLVEIVREMNEVGRTLIQENDFGVASVSVSYADDPSYSIRENAWDLLEEKLRYSKDQRGFAIENCELSQRLATASVVDIQTGRILNDLPSRIRMEISNKWLNR